MLKEMDLYSQISFVLVLVGGVFWGLSGLFGFDFFTGILGNLIGRLVSIVVGAGAGWLCYQIYLEKMKKA